MTHGVDTNDSLVVLDVTGNSWAARNSTEIIEWLTNNLPARNPFFDRSWPGRSGRRASRIRQSRARS